MKWFILLTCALFTSLGSAEPAETEDNVVILLGRRKEATDARATGRSVTIKPDDASRFDTITHLKRESSVIAPETGRPSPSGFVVPRIRGQDTKLTDVYVDDVLLQDPYSSLPLIEDLDLRAFGELEIHQGLAPVDVPGLNPIGTLRYRMRTVRASSATIGLQSGVPLIWSLGVYHAAEEGTVKDARLYVRDHRTDGRYLYYSDEGTPYNTDDDTLLIRENNDQRSLQAVPFLRYRKGPYKVQGLSWVYRGNRGLASSSAAVPSSAREASNGYLVQAQVSRDFLALGILDETTLGFNATTTRDHRGVTDPEKTFLVTADASDLTVASRRFGLTAQTRVRSTEVFSSAENGTATVNAWLGARRAHQLERRSTQGSLGMRVRPLALWTIEAKTAGRSQHDHRLSALEPGDQTRSANALGVATSVADNAWGLYLQWGRAKRLPSLLESYGDGSALQPNLKLVPEALVHRELGAFLKGSTFDWRLGTAMYRDLVDDKIVIIPVMANASKALNRAHTEITGIDLRGEVAFGRTALYLSQSWLSAYDRSDEQGSLLPGIPQRVVVAEVEQKLGTFTARWLARYRSVIYRDLENSIELPGAILHDAYFDYSYSRLRLGLAIRNVFDILSVPITTPTSDGETSYSDYAGAPLPGRQYLASLSYSI